MNGKDAKAVAEILAANFCDDDLCDAIFKLDERIEPHYLEMRSVVSNLRKVKANYERRLIDQYGQDWESKASEADKAEALEAARRLIYGDDYDPDLFVGEAAQ